MSPSLITGTLVKLGQHLASGQRRIWSPYLLLWAGFVAGAVAGAAAFPLAGPPALWFVACWAALLLAGSTRLGPA